MKNSDAPDAFILNLTVSQTCMSHAKFVATISSADSNIYEMDN